MTIESICCHFFYNLLENIFFLNFMFVIFKFKERYNKKGNILISKQSVPLNTLNYFIFGSRSSTVVVVPFPFDDAIFSEHIETSLRSLDARFG